MKATDLMIALSPDDHAVVIHALCVYADTLEAFADDCESLTESEQTLPTDKPNRWREQSRAVRVLAGQISAQRRGGSYTRHTDDELDAADRELALRAERALEDRS